jgi:hypothetical protein
MTAGQDFVLTIDICRGSRCGPWVQAWERLLTAGVSASDREPQRQPAEP